MKALKQVQVKRAAAAAAAVATSARNTPMPPTIKLKAE